MKNLLTLFLLLGFLASCGADSSSSKTVNLKDDSHLLGDGSNNDGSNDTQLSDQGEDQEGYLSDERPSVYTYSYPATCSSKVVSDLDIVDRYCFPVLPSSSIDEANECMAVFNEFVEKYPGISCSYTDPYGLDWHLYESSLRSEYTTHSNTVIQNYNLSL